VSGRKANQEINSHCARTAQQNQDFRSRENKEENQKGHGQDPNKSFLLKFKTRIQ
jgi:hypothetical protein